MDKVIFACVHNAGRSQMAAAFFNHLANPKLAHAISAGTDPADRVHPVVVEVMREAGIDISGGRPQRLTVALAHDAVLLVTMGCGDQCPYLPGVTVADWPLPDPKDRSVEEVRRIRDDVRARIDGLVTASGWARDHRS
jgi:protein-tyrosine-phosphatase